MKLHSIKMKSYLLLVFGCLIFAEQTTADNETSTVTSSSTHLSPETSTDLLPNSTTIAPNSTTVTIPTTTVIPSTTTVNPPSAGNPSTGSWTVFCSEGIACIKLEAAIQFSITYEQNTEKRNVTTKLNVPKNATAQNLTSEEQQIVLKFDDNVFTITFKNDSDKISATKFALTYFVDEVKFPDAVEQNKFLTANASNETEFQVPQGKSYLCKTETTIKLGGDVVLSMQELRVEAFRHKKDDSFSDAIECTGDDKIYDIVPIAVGCALAVLVIIVLIAYLVGRQRSRQQGYQSV